MIRPRLEGALADGVGKLAALGHVIPGQDVVAHNPGPFPQAQLRAHLGDVGVLKTGDIVLEEPPGDQVLLAALNHAAGQIPGVGGQGVVPLRGVLEMGLDMAALPGGQEEAHAGVGMPVAVFQPHVPQLVETHQLAQLGDIMALAVNIHHGLVGVVRIRVGELLEGKLVGVRPHVGEQGAPIHAVDLWARCGSAAI